MQKNKYFYHVFSCSYNIFLTRGRLKIIFRLFKIFFSFSKKMIFFVRFFIFIVILSI